MPDERHERWRCLTRLCCEAILLTVGSATVAWAQRDARPEADSGRAVVRGHVRDAASRQPIPAVRIRVRSSPLETSTDDAGNFVLDVGTPRRIALLLIRLGYDSVTRALDAPTAPGDRVVVELHRSALTLDTVAVVDAMTTSAKLEGFERRRQRGGGTYIDRPEIVRRRPLATTDLLRRVIGIRVVDSMGVRLVASARGGKIVRQGPRMQTVPCVLRVGVDGQVKEWGFTPDQVPPEEIHGIEIYSGPATIPREFATQGTDAFCGLVMIWTR